MKERGEKWGEKGRIKGQWEEGAKERRENEKGKAKERIGKKGREGKRKVGGEKALVIAFWLTLEPSQGTARTW